MRFTSSVLLLTMLVSPAFAFSVLNVPEPASITVLGAGLVSMLLLRRKKK